MTSLPVISDDGALAVPDLGTGELVDLRDAPDRALLVAAARVAELDAQLYAAKRALAAELHDRYGVGTATAGGYRFQVTEAQSWPATATHHALMTLLAERSVSPADIARAMPSKPKPDARALKALIQRLTVKDPDAARILAGACTVSPPSLRDITPIAVDETKELPHP